MHPDLLKFCETAGIDPNGELAEELAKVNESIIEAATTMVDLPDGSQMSRWDYLQTIVYPFVGQSK
jgi:hypothetical protein